VIGYYIGAVFMQILGCPIVGFYHGERIFDQLAFTFNRHSFWAIFIAAVTPIPYKVFTIAAGALQADFGTFLLASGLGRPLRFFSVGLLIFLFGRPVKAFIDRYFNFLSVVFVVLLIGGFVVVKKFSDGFSPPSLGQDVSSVFHEICAGFR
jgi:membrane protein DedA with SNARE-associated domain